MTNFCTWNLKHFTVCHLHLKVLSQYRQNELQNEDNYCIMGGEERYFRIIYQQQMSISWVPAMSGDCMLFWKESRTGIELVWRYPVIWLSRKKINTYKTDIMK